LNDPRFLPCPGAHHLHHAYEGGLVTHTAEVMRIALATAEAMERPVQTDVLRCAAIYHDYCKIFDYTVRESTDEMDYKIFKTEYRFKIRHVSGSYAEFIHNARELELEDDLIMAIGHCILAHHGRYEYGSPVEPQTLEALILHQADMLSYQYGKTSRSL
jgi:3'-5' exoribonuclease